MAKKRARKATTKSNTVDSKFRILSLDGGGIRGVITATWLDALEQKLKSPIADHFDLIAGTSTGSILACAVSHGLPAKQILQMYVDYGRTVFPATAERLWSRAWRTFVQGSSAPKYDGRGLARVLKEQFGRVCFGNLSVPTLVTSYNTRTRQAAIFKSTAEQHKRLPVWEVVKSSCSAPTFFPAHILSVAGAMEPLIDGGVVANNPVACAIAEGVVINKRKKTGLELNDFVVVSMGTGSTTRPITARDAQEWGALEWAIPINDVLMDGAGDATAYIARQLVPENRFFRFQTPLDTAFDDMDDASKTNINALSSLANEYLRQEGNKMVGQIQRLL